MIKYLFLAVVVVLIGGSFLYWSHTSSPTPTIVNTNGVTDEDVMTVNLRPGETKVLDKNLKLSVVSVGNGKVQTSNGDQSANGWNVAFTLDDNQWPGSSNTMGPYWIQLQKITGSAATFAIVNAPNCTGVNFRKGQTLQEVLNCR